MTKKIQGKTYRSHTAVWIVTVPCPFPPTNPRWHQTDVYRNQQGAYFLAGTGGAHSRWAKQTPQGAIPGEGIEPLTKAEALAYATQYGVSHDRFARLGFERPPEP